MKPGARTPPFSLDFVALGKRCFQHDGLDLAIAEYQRALVMKALAVEDARACNC